MLKSRYIMVGGFLGAGKTTAVAALAEKLNASGMTIGLITNDQSVGLVDTRLLQSKGFATQEITGGCFCCRFTSLIQAADSLSAEERPDCFIAEPVGSCTDLRATVGYPLQRLYGDEFAVAPLSVLLDPLRVRRVLGIDRDKSFSAKVLYIFEKQMEEADILVINKCDLLAAGSSPSSSESQKAFIDLKQALDHRFPDKRVIGISAKTGQGIDGWLSLLLVSEASQGEAMEVDYDVYAEGEALMGWLNIATEIAGSEFDGNQFLLNFAGRIQASLSEKEIEIAHLKMTLDPDSGNDLAAGNLVASSGRFQLSHELLDRLEIGELIINLRAEADASVLKDIVQESLKACLGRYGLSEKLIHAEAFQPGRPVPTHRFTRPSVTS
jgi:Ni2+-binding GTPase involved in maturation of urease and hydrogenase